MNYRNRYHKTAARTNARGFTNLQITLGLAIVAIAIVAALGGFRKLDEAGVNAAIDEVSDLKVQTVKYAAQRGGDFTGVDTNLCANKWFDSDRITGTGASTTINNKFKGTITCQPATSTSTNDSLTFTYTGIPAVACIGITSSVTKAAVIAVGGTTVKPLGGNLNESSAITQCNAANDNATIAFTFTR